jgi:hypothetical protein
LRRFPPEADAGDARRRAAARRAGIAIVGFKYMLWLLGRKTMLSVEIFPIWGIMGKCDGAN